MDDATHVDTARGIRETASFVGRDDCRMFTVLHAPLGQPSGAILVCPSLNAEMTSNYRREVVFARAMAQLGVAVLRFHYRGSGHSEGDAGEMDEDTLREDAVLALDVLRNETGCDRAGLLATRLGAVPASHLVTEAGGVLALWEPVIDGAKYLKDTLRKRAFRELALGAHSPTSREALLEEMNAVGHVDVLGYPIHRTLYGSIERFGLLDSLGETPGELLIVQIDRTNELRAQYRRLVDTLSARGWSVEARAIVGEDAWWFAALGWQSDEEEPMTKELLASTTSWFVEALASEVIGER